MGWMVGACTVARRGGEGLCKVEGEAERREGEWGEGGLAGLRRDGEGCWCALERGRRGRAEVDVGWWCALMGLAEVDVGWWCDFVGEWGPRPTQARSRQGINKRKVCIH